MIDLLELKKALEDMTPRQNIYKVVKAALLKHGNRKNRDRGAAPPQNRTGSLNITRLAHLGVECASMEEVNLNKTELLVMALERQLERMQLLTVDQLVDDLKSLHELEQFLTPIKSERASGLLERARKIKPDFDAELEAKDPQSELRRKREIELEKKEEERRRERELREKDEGLDLDGLWGRD